MLQYFIKAELLQVDIFFLMRLYAGEILLLKALVVKNSVLHDFGVLDSRNLLDGATAVWLETLFQNRSRAKHCS